MSHPDRALHAVTADGLMTEHLLHLLTTATAPEKCLCLRVSWRCAKALWWLSESSTTSAKVLELETQGRHQQSCLCSYSYCCPVLISFWQLSDLERLPWYLAQALDVDQLLESNTLRILLNRN